MALQVSIGQVKRDISELVNKVAYGGERIVLTSRGKPKAVLVSMSDYEQLTAQRQARFAVIRELQDAAPDLPFEQVEKEVAEAVKEVRRKNAAGRP
jgi:prevent-host-death family protein